MHSYSHFFFLSGQESGSFRTSGILDPFTPVKGRILEIFNVLDLYNFRSDKDLNPLTGGVPNS